MPRRKKKSSLARKPSLVFTESPVHVQNNVPSPVLCARHPPTASSVPVDELHHLPWVSPQFRNVRHSGGQSRRRLTRQRRHSIAGHKSIAASHIDNKENLTSSTRNKLRKFNSLKFVGDKTNIPSIIEDMEVSIDEETETDNENEAGFNEIKEKGSPCDDNSENNKWINELGIQGRYSEIEFGKICRRGRKVIQGETDDPLTIKTEKDGSVLTDVDAMSVELQESATEEITTNLNNTQRRYPVKEKPPIKRLFASQLLSKDDKCDKESSGCVNDIKQMGKMVELDNNSLTIPESDKSDTDSVQSPHVRRSERIRELRKMLLSLDSPCSVRKLTCEKIVLAPNTPENEYGWSKRKRQLIRYIKKKS
ncbi:uncharacterized protein LOC123537621 [Mercenaria mercenaria]|uniref:uncharacterized protein LOC123537621 n=1 Tax=Mercenaria mercenaria TaxID=6596 RepID=UPI00234F8592|nr:uncharacterized protein LOC123537621 [Mercenaria mercenaria]XP_045177391.2 uncharacterized protein LOC123537621 [Mercenaria mercenaria]